MLLVLHFHILHAHLRRGVSATLSVAADPADRAVSACRHHRPLGAAGGGGAAREIQPARHHREQARRQRRDRPARDAQGRARRLHADGRHGRLGGHRLCDRGEPAVRCAARPGPDRRHRGIRDRHGGQQQDPGELGAGVHRLFQGAAGQAQLRLDRRRRLGLSRGRAVHEGDRHQPAACALSRRTGGAQRSHGRIDRPADRSFSGGDGADQDPV